MGDKTTHERLKGLSREMIESLIDNPYECPIVVDAKGFICFMSHYSKNLINIDPEEAVGRHIWEVIPETHLHEVLIGGKARIGDTLYIAGKQQIISRIPLKDTEGNIIGAVGKGMFNQTSKVLELNRRIDQLNGEVQYLQEQLNIVKGGAEIVGNSEAIASVKKEVLQAAKTNVSVLITGESGTGKEVIAYAVHSASNRAKKPFIRVNCAAIPSELFESELFGYEKGAFTGAHTKGKPGKFELARGGTIFLDEIGELPLPLQAKLLRVIQERTIDRLGGTRPVEVDFRLIAATNRNLLEMVRKELFRMDLYFRIDVFEIHAPSLREIKEDIPVLSKHLIASLKDEVGGGATSIDEEALEILKRYPWPGNVRELRNVLERAMIVSKDAVIRPEDLPVMIRNYGRENAKSSHLSYEGTLRQILEETEKAAILEALRKTGGNKVKTAKILGIHRSSLYEKMKMAGLDEK
jgi:transcriptional regulator with PAS, ATPase and Fis domain